MINKTKIVMIAGLCFGSINSASFMRAMGRTANTFMTSGQVAYSTTCATYEVAAPTIKSLMLTGLQCVEKYAASAQRIFNDEKSNPRTFEDVERVVGYGVGGTALLALAAPYAPVVYNGCVIAGNVLPLVPYVGLCGIAAAGGATLAYHLYNIMNEENAKAEALKAQAEALKDAILSVAEINAQTEAKKTEIEQNREIREATLKGMNEKSAIRNNNKSSRVSPFC